jgi:hypothetical protein
MAVVGQAVQKSVVHVALFGEGQAGRDYHARVLLEPRFNMRDPSWLLLIRARKRPLASPHHAALPSAYTELSPRPLRTSHLLPYSTRHRLRQISA